jgi:16S rRNA (uracil1498-N3)-methyltransferase
MAHPRILIADLPAEGGTVTIDGPALRHLRALRLGVGDRFVVFDGGGRECVAVLSDLGRRAAAATLAAAARTQRESPLELELAPALLKGARMDLVFEKGTELGVTRFRPLLTTRVQGRRDQRDRWRRIVRAAAEQSGRTRVPAVDAPRPLTAVLQDTAGAVLLVAFEDERGRGLAHTPDRARRVVAVTGPEGGLTGAEVAEATSAAAHVVGLGPRLLRAETAAVVLTALAQQRWGDG